VQFLVSPRTDFVLFVSLSVCGLTPFATKLISRPVTVSGVPRPACENKDGF
jgi:hypothetical protein